MTAAAQSKANGKSEISSRSRRDELVNEHLYLVKAIAAHIQKSLPIHVELDDLIHAGTMGLLSAASKFQDEKAVAFSAYAKHRIRGAILDSLREADYASRDTRKRYKQREVIIRDLTSNLGRTPTDAEVAKAMNLEPKKYQALLVEFRALAGPSSSYKDAEREDEPLDEATAPVTQNPDQVFARRQMQEKLSLAMGSLPQRYQQVVKLYYEGDMSMKEIGSYLGVNESRISQIHRSALAKMNVFFGNAGIQSAAAF